MGFENGKLWRVTLNATNGPNQMVNVWHYDAKDDGALSDINSGQSLADFFRDNVLSHQRALFAPTWTVNPVVVTDEVDPSKPPGQARSQWVSGTAAPGTRQLSSDAMALALCSVAILKTDSIGRRHTGRKFIFGSFQESDVSGDTWIPQVDTLIQLYLDSVPRQPDVSGGPGAASCDLCVYSRTNRAALQNPYASHVQSIVLSNRVHWLRSRRPA